MAVDIHRHRILRVINEDRDIDELVAIPMQYSQILSLMRSMIADGLIERVEAKLVLTQAGRDAILQLPAEQVSTAVDPLEAAKTQKEDPRAVHIPQSMLR